MRHILIFLLSITSVFAQTNYTKPAPGTVKEFITPYNANNLFEKTAAGVRDESRNPLTATTVRFERTKTFFQIPYSAPDEAWLYPEYNQAFSGHCWVKVGSVGMATTMDLPGTFNTGNNRGIIWTVQNGNQKLNIQNSNSTFLSKTGGGIVYNSSNYVAVVEVGKWAHLAWTYDGSGNSTGIKLYLNGYPQYASASGGSGLASTIKAGVAWRCYNDISTHFDGQLSTWCLHNVELTATEIYNAAQFNVTTRGLIVKHNFEEGSGAVGYNSYKTSSQISTYGQTVGNATYNELSAGIGTLTHVAQSPQLYSWCNKHGYRLSSSVYIPRNEASASNVDATGTSLGFTKEVRYPISFINSNCGNAHTTSGTLDLNTAVAAGSTITYSGTATAVLNGSRDKITISGTGTIYNISIKNSSAVEIHHFTVAEGAGLKLYDRYGLNNITLTSFTEATFWNTTQSVYHANLTLGCSKYTHSSSNPIRVAFGTTGQPLTITAPSGYTKIKDSPAQPNYQGLTDVETKINFNPYSTALTAPWTARFTPSSLAVSFTLPVTIPTAYSFAGSQFVYNDTTAQYFVDRSNSLVEKRFILYNQLKLFNERGVILNYIRKPTLIFLQAGQSNSVGFGTVATLAATGYSANVTRAVFDTNYFYLPSTTGFIQAPANNEGNEVGAELFYTADAITNYNSIVWWRKYAVAGTNLAVNGVTAYWYPTPTTDVGYPTSGSLKLYPNMIADFKPTIDILKASNREIIACFQWDQAENDLGSTTYGASLKYFFETATSDLGLTAHKTYYIARRLAPVQYPSPSGTTTTNLNITRAQIESLADVASPNYLLNYGYVNSDDCAVKLGDEIHFSTDGQRLIGQRRAAKLLELLPRL